MKNDGSYFQGIAGKQFSPEQKLPQLFAITATSDNSENVQNVVYTIN